MKALIITITALLFPSTIFADDWWILNGSSYDCEIAKPTAEEQLLSGRCEIRSINDRVGRLSMNCNDAILVYFTTEEVCIALADKLKQRTNEQLN